MTHFSYKNYLIKAFNVTKNKLPNSYSNQQIALNVLKNELTNFSNDDAFNINKDICSFIKWVENI